MVEKSENQEESNVNNELFKGVSFCLCDDINDFENVKRILLDKGGKHVNYLSDYVTHLIADNPEHPNVLDAIDIFDKVAVTSEWVILSEKANVLLPLEPFYTDRKTKIFDKLIVAVSSNLSKEDRSKLWAMIKYYGGELQLNLTDKCTHLVTGRCNGRKFDKACSLGNLKIVSPDWILDSIKQSKRCDEASYHPKYLITPEYLQMKKEREERVRLEQERKRKEEEARKLEAERKRLEDEKRRNEEKKRIEEERKRFLDEERKKLEEAKKNAAATNIVQSKLSNVNISSSSSNPSSSTQTAQTGPAISTQPNSSNVPATQLTLRTVSLPSSTIVSNISSSTQPATTATINSAIKQGQAQKFKLVLPSNQLNQLNRMPQNTTTVQTAVSNLQNPQQQQQYQQQQQQQQQSIQQQQQQQNTIYTTADQTMINQQQQQQHPIQFHQQVTTQVNAIQKPIINNANQVNAIQQQQQQQNYQQQTIITNQSQLRTGDQINQPRQQIRGPQQQQVYLAVQQPQIQYSGGRPNQFNLIQFRQPQFAAVSVQQQQQMAPGQQNQQQIRGVQQQIRPQLVQQQTIVSNSNNNMAPKLQTSASEQPANVVQPNTVQKSTNIILQQRVQPPVQMQAQQSNQQQQQQQQTSMQTTTTNIQPMIIQQQPNAQLTANTAQLGPQSNQQHSIQVLPGQQIFQIQRHPVPVPGQINQQQILRGQNQQIIFHQPTNLQQNGPRQAIPQGAIFQQSPNQNQIQRVQQLRMPQNIQQGQNQQVRLTVSPIHAQQQTNQSNANLNPGQQSPAAQLKPQRFLIKSPPQFIQQQQQQQATATSMTPIRTPIQQNQPQINQQINQNQLIGQISPQIGKPQIINKFQTNQQPANQIRNQWTNDQSQQIMRPVTPNQQMMQIGPNQVIMSPAHGTIVQQHSQQMGQQTTMILQGQPQNIQQHTIQQHSMNQQMNAQAAGQWSTTGNQQQQQQQQQQQLTPTMVQVKPTQNVQMHNVQIQQQSPQIRLIHQQPATPTTPQLVNQQRINTPTTPNTPTLIASSGGHHPQITDPNVSNQSVRIEQVNCIISNVPLQTLNASGDQSVVTSKTKSALANLLNNRLKNSSQTIASSSSLVAQSKKDSSSTSSRLDLGASNKAIDTLRNLDGCSPNSNSSLSHDFSSLETEVVIDKYYNYDSKLNVPSDLCLIGCVFYLVEYEQGVFKLNDSKRRSIEINIIKYGGYLVNAYDSKVTHVICESFSNQLVQRALKENKRCVTVFWLDDVLEDKKMRYPFRPWHLPRKFNLDASPCKNKIISISNFNTTERNRIYEMIYIAKGKYTSYMTQQNNLLICKKFDGIKLTKAVEWGINVVNQQWLQDMWFDKLKDINDRRYTVCDPNKDAVDLDYTLTKDLMTGWKTSLKLNEHDQKRLTEFKEACLSRNWKKPEIAVLVSKENILNSSSSLSTNNTSKPNLPDKNSNSNSNNQNSNSSNEISQSPQLSISNTSTSTVNTSSTINTIATSTSTATTNSSTLSTFVISNSTDTLTIVTVSTCSDKLNKKSPSITTSNSTVYSSTSSPSPLSLQIKTENVSTTTSTTTTTTTNQTDRKELAINELSIKKEKVDNEYMDTDSKVPIATHNKAEQNVQKEDNQMEVDRIISNNNDQTLKIATTLTSSTDPITTQSTNTKPSLIEIKPNNLDEQEISKMDSLIPTNDEMKRKDELKSIHNSTDSIVCTTSPLVLTVSSVNTQSNSDSATATISTTKSTTSGTMKTDNLQPVEVGLVNGDHNPNDRQQSTDVEMMEVVTSATNKIEKNTIVIDNKSPNNKELRDECDQPLAKRLKLEEERMDVQSNSIDSRDNSKDERSNEEPKLMQTMATAIAKEDNGTLMNGLQTLDSSSTTEIVVVKKESAEENGRNKSQTKSVEDNNLIKSKWSPESIKVFFTNVPNSKELSDIVLSLGGKLVNNGADCTHLVSSKVERTINFVCAFNYAHFILVPDWLIKSKESGCFLNERDYFLNDQLNEEHFGFSIKDSFERREKRDRLLFNEMIFYITRSCIPSFKILMQIIRSAGGLSVAKSPPTSQQLDRMKSTGLKFVVISCERDLHLCDLFYEKNIPVLHSEFVLSNILRQTIEYEPYMIGYN